MKFELVDVIDTKVVLLQKTKKPMRQFVALVFSRQMVSCKSLLLADSKLIRYSNFIFKLQKFEVEKRKSY